ncbi:hypothetical protein ACFVT6_09655 [Streptomyces sp. NPDC058049]|uniref:hypothetical protein n=1 Tax=Streptomyces sp. NPDC058049 TaxID=3346314 RepID=UPI0036E15C11
MADPESLAEPAHSWLASPSGRRPPGGGVVPAEYGTWVSAAQPRPLPGVDLGRVPTHPVPNLGAGPVTSAPVRWARLLDGRVHGRPATVHAEGRPSASDRTQPLGTMQALDAPARPGTTACIPATDHMSMFAARPDGLRSHDDVLGAAGEGVADVREGDVLAH